MRSLRESSGSKMVLSFLAFAMLVWAFSAMFVGQVQAAQRHTEGSVVLDGGTVWHIGATEKHGFRTAAEFLSHGYSFAQLQAATDADRALTTGTPMKFADGTLVNDGGTIYMVNEGVKRGFTSASVFLGLGYSFANVYAGSSADFTAGAVVDSASAAHPAGSLVLDGNTVWQIRANGRAGVASMDVFNSYGWKFSRVVAANAADRALAVVANVAARMNGGSLIDDGSVVTPPSSGSVSVSLASDSPAAATLVTDQALADLAHFTFSGSGTVSAVVLERIGVSADSTLEDIFLFDGAQRLTDSATVSSGSKINFTGMSLAVSGSKTIAVKADIASSTSGQTVGIRLVSYTVSGGSAATVSVSGAIHTVASATLAGVAVAAPTATGDTDPGNDLNVWQSTVTVSTRDVNMTRLALRQLGSIPAADIKNFRLQVDGVQVATSAALDANGYVTFSVPNTALKTGARVLKVMADVIGGSNRTVQMSLRGSYDLNVTDSQYNVGAEPTGTFPASPTAFTVSQGSITVVKASDSPSGNITDAASDALYGKFTFTAFGEAIKVETLTVGFDTDGTDADKTVRNVRVMVGGSQVGSTTSVPASATASVGTSFTTNFVVSPGTPVAVEVRGDVFDNEGTEEFTDGSTIQVRLVQGSSNGIRQVSLGSVNVPTANVTGNSLTVKQGGLTMAKTTTYGDQTIVDPQTAYKIASFQLSGNSTENVNVTSFDLDIAVTDSSGSEFTIADITDVYIKYGSNQTSVKPTVAATANTWSPSFSVAKNSSMQVDVYGSIGSDAASSDTVVASLQITGTASESGASADTTNIAGQTITIGSATITATKDASSLDSQLVDDSGTVASAAFKFAAVNDSYTVTDLTITLGSTSAVQNVIIKDGTTVVATQPATQLTFSGLSVPVSANTNKVLTVNLEMGPVGSSGQGATGAALLTTLTAFTARNSQGVSAAGTEADPAGNAMYAYKSVPLVSYVALPTTVMSNADQVIAKFTVSSNGTGTVAWKEILLEISKTGGASGDPALTVPFIRNADTGVTITAAEVFQNSSEGPDADCDNLDTTCELMVTINTKLDDDVEEQISGAKTYEVVATVGGTLATNDYISTKVDRNTTTFAASAVFTTNDNAATADSVSFTWSDVSNVSHDTGTADWAKDFLVKNLPTSTWTLTK